MNEIARMQNTTLFKELRLAGFKTAWGYGAACTLQVWDGDEQVCLVEPVLIGGRTWWVVEGKRNRFHHTRYGTWEEVEEAVYEAVKGEA